MKQLLKEIRDNNILLELVDGNLKVFANGSTVKPALIAEIRENKAELIRLLKDTDQNGSKHSFAGSIPLLPAQENYSLSSAQRRIWILSQFEQSNAAYNIPQACILEGNLHIGSLEYAFQKIIERHEILRTVFKEDRKGNIKQFILLPEQVAVMINRVDLREEKHPNKQLAAFLQKEMGQTFDLVTGPLIRISLFQTGNKKWIFSYIMHHIISDGWSMVILLKELLLFYSAHVTGEHVLPAPLHIQYKEYASWQQKNLKGEALPAHKEYWLRKLGGDLPVLDLPVDKPRPAVKTYHGNVIAKAINKKLVEKLKKVSQAQGATLFMSLLSIVYTLLHRYSGQEDIIIGAPTAGREHLDLEEQIGVYLNTLALRTEIKGENTYKELLGKVKKVVLEAYEHQAYPFDELVADLNLQRDMSRSAIFDVLIDFHDTKGMMKNDYPGNLTVREYENNEHRVSKFDLTFMFIESDTGLSLSLEYNSDLYEKDTIKRMHIHFEELLRQVASKPNLAISSLRYIGREEHNKLLFAFNDIPVNYEQYKSVISLFIAQVNRTPDAIAITFKDIALTYKDLDEKSNRVANYLINNCHVGRGDLAGIMLGRSELMIIAILGILKSGAAYVPVDPEYPETRRQYIFLDTGIKVLLTEANFIYDLTSYSGHVFSMDLQLDDLDTSAEPPAGGIHPYDQAYVIYTSGSTGDPKGCCITHNNLSNYIQWANDYYFGQSGIPDFGLYTSLSFDLTVTSIFCTLTLGGSLFVYDQQQPMQDILLHSFVSNSINAIKITPSHIRILKHLDIKATGIRNVIIGGEEVTREHVSILKGISSSLKIYNEYGPTETTVGCVVKELDENVPVLIGKPISRTSIFILDKNYALCAIGIPGEICIGGTGLAKGYLNKDALTAEKFISNPFKKGERMYRTGDIGKWLPRGNIKFFGRIDDQVKIRGYRVELGEIENALQSQPVIEMVAVIAKPGNDGEKELLAYFTSREKTDPAVLRSLLARTLPSFMIPHYFIQLDEMPLTHNGKTDRKKLPAPESISMHPGTLFIAPRNSMEEKMIEILQEILGKQKIGIKDNFFALGGDSIKAITFIVNIRRQLGFDISVDKLYESPSLEDLSDFMLANGQSLQHNSMDIYLEAGLQEIARIREQVEKENDLENRLPAMYEDIYPVVPIEQGMIYSSMLNPEEPVYYDQFSYLVKIGDFDLFTNALRKLVQRHPILRTQYYMSSFSRPVKVVLQDITIPFSFEDISHLPEEDKLKRINNYIEKDLNSRLSFDNELLWRLNMFRLAESEYHVTYSFHHALLDGWSVSIFKTELSNFDANLPALLQHSYKDYCAILLGKSKSKDIDSYWQRLMKGYIRNKLPFNYKGIRVSEEKGMKRCARTIDDGLLQRLMLVASEHVVSFKTICLAAHVYLMHIICSEQDVVTGVVTHDRPEIEDSEKILGCFLNTVPIRVEIGKVDNLLSLLKQVSNFLTEANRNEIHLSEIAGIIEDRTSSANPMFDTILNYTDFHSFENLSQNGLYTDPGEVNMEVAHEMTNTLFDVEVDKTLQRFSVKIKYTPAYFDETEIRYALDLYVRILENIAVNIVAPLKSLNLLAAAELKEVLVDFNATEAPYAEKKTVHQLFEEQVLKTPNGIALQQHGATVTYQLLNERANRLANYLVSKGVLPGDNIGLLVTRSFDMIIGMYGILKAGGAYVPVDPEYPAERQEYIVRNSGVIKILTDATYPLSNNLADVEFILLQDEKVVQYSVENPGLPVNSKQLAYTIYTSGSTGRPKGVMIEHHSVINLVEWVNDEFEVGRNDRLLFITSMCFDLSVYDIFGILSCGGTAVIVRQEEVQDVRKLKELMKLERITFWDSVPTTMSYLAGELEHDADDYIQKDLRIVFLSGDWIPVQLPDRIRKFFPNANVISLGGATEGTVWSNYYPVNKTGSSWSSIPYGRPIKNNFFYVLDDCLRAVPKGVTGELYIGGVGVARGYANDPEKTAFSFKEDPFNDRKGGRMYKTGDIGRMMADGNMEFIGRKDNQVKIRGFRVELGEIESVLLKHGSVKEAIVDVYKDAGNNNRLCAYVVANNQVNIPEIKDYLKRIVPSYMVPNEYMVIEALPLNSNGKINRKALPRPEENAEEKSLSHIAPVTATEIAITDIWKSILQTDRIGMHDDFFDRGANSLSVGAFVNRVHREMGKVVSIREVFINPTIGGIAQILDGKSNSGFELINAAPRENSYQLSSAQRQLWVLNQFEDGNLSYHIPAVYIFEGDLNNAALDYAFSMLIGRHEILRTVFREDKQEEIRQFILTPGETGFRISFTDLRNENDPEKKAGLLVHKEFITPFDLTCGPLIRAALFQVADNKWVFTYTLHHIVSDGWSTGIVINDLLLFYNNYTQQVSQSLKPLVIQYKDYAVWQQQQLTTGAFSEHKKYWLKQFAGELPVLDMQGDRMRPPLKSFNGGTLQKIINPALTAGLRSLAREQGGTMFMSLLTAVYTLLYRYTNQEDIIIGSPVAGRGHADLENQIGFYVNTLAFRTRFSGDNGYKELFENVKQVTLGAYSHQAYPFDEMIFDLDIQRDVSRGTLFDVMVILQNNRTNYEKAQQNVPGIQIHEFEEGKNVNSKFDLVFDFVEVGDEVQLKLEFNSDIFYRESVQRLADHFEQLLGSIINHPLEPIKHLDYLSIAEKENLLIKFNNTDRAYPKDKTIASLLYEQAARTPESIALIYENKLVSYNELNQASNQVADYLRSTYKVLPDDIIGVKLERSEWIVAVILGIIKSGGACMPVDPESPADRAAYILENSKCKILIDEQEIAKFMSTQNQYSRDDLKIVNRPHDLAYVIHTSGSTGNPKGCMLENRGVLNHLYSKIYSLQLKADESLCHNSEMHFVGGIWQLLAPLVTGGKVVLCSKEELRDFGTVLYKANFHEANILEVIPSQLNEYLFYEKEIKLGSIGTLILTGEKLNPLFVNKCYTGNEQVQILNTYGQTEFSDVTCCYNIPHKKGNTVLIGSPIQNTRIYILSPGGSLCPIGVAGEIYTSGDGISRGYINQPQLTSQKFVINPYRDGYMMYKTGDLARWLPDGNLEITGRKDDQVKIRGHRIEIGEIEIALLQYKIIDEAVVLFTEGKNGEKTLVAYIVSKYPFNASAIRNHLLPKIPNYMLPGYYVQIDKMPLLQNGKIDKKALSALDNLQMDRGTEYVVPNNEIEWKLAEIWEDILQKRMIGVMDNFFELGGHSLKASTMANRIRQSFNVTISLKQIFQAPLISLLAKEIQKKVWMKQSSEADFKTEEPREVIIL